MVNVTISNNNSLNISNQNRNSVLVEKVISSIPINVITANKKTVDVLTDNEGLITTNEAVVLKNAPTFLNTPTRLDRLNDVDSSGESEGATLVYDAATDKYVTKRIDFDIIDGILDGGTF